MALGNAVYNILFRRTSTVVLTVIVGGIFFERMYDSWADLTWERMNRGVRMIILDSIFNFLHVITNMANGAFSHTHTHMHATEIVEGYQAQL